VFVYKSGKDGAGKPAWQKQVLDAGGMGAAACAAADLNADRAIDIVCISSTTLKWYEGARR
jgi:hypothetical protein